MIRGLAQHLNENDIRKDISDCGLTARDIRLIRKKETGTVKTSAPSLLPPHPADGSCRAESTNFGLCTLAISRRLT